MTVAQPAPVRSFPFRVSRAARLLLWGWGVGIRPTEVTLGPDSIAVRFGWFGATFPLTDVVRGELQGPFHWVRAVGVRHTWFTRDISFCTDERGALVLFLATPRRIAFVRAVEMVYLGIEDRDGLAAALRERGIEVEDKRHR